MSHAPAQFQLDAPPFAASVLRGRLVISAPDQLAVRRSDPRAGEVTVHFPRIGYQMGKVAR